MRYKDFRDELMNAIVEVVQETGMTVNQCIMEAKKMLRQQMEEHYKKQNENQLFKGW